MRNPFARVARDDTPKPTLRERAATLKATAARVMRGEPLETEVDQDRRSVVKGSLVAAAIPLPLLASQAMAAPALTPALPHPDQALFDAEAAVSRTKTALEAAERAAIDAHRAFWDTLGPCPAALVVKPWERITFGSASKPWIKHHPRWAWVDRYEGDEGRPDPMVKVWTAESLRATIRNAVLLFGKGGQTPHQIREWRSLLPVAEAFESRRADLNVGFRYDELRAARKTASEVHHAAVVAFADMPAKTLDGLVLKTRQLEGCGWHRMPSHWVSLLQSAAAVSGVTLSAPDFDVPAWVKGWEEAGGIIKRHPISGELGYHCPSLPEDASPAASANLKRLRDDLGAHDVVISRWLRAYA